VTAAAREASTDSFHLAVLVAAGLMVVGAAVNGFGIRNPQRVEEKEEAPPEARPARVDKVPEEVPCLPVPSPTALPSDARMHLEPGSS
jgi:hypothetical protein